MVEDYLLVKVGMVEDYVLVEGKNGGGLFAGGGWCIFMLFRARDRPAKVISYHRHW